MSQTIHVLPDHVANQIAAGEVIQRPASVVKELMENAVDAGATSIEVHVLDAGRTSIQVLDNGSGMSSEDARVCFERHATSKLQSADDLFALATKGFRGEALASIAAIAHVDVTTCQAGAEVGTRVRCHGSEIAGEEPRARAVGTTFHVKNLFYNVPARRNFLKSDAVELRHVVDEFQRVAFAHPGIAFTLTHQNANLFQLKPGTMRQRIVGILGPKYDERLVPVQEETDVVRIEGFVGKPDSARKTRGEQFLFVNGRFVKHGLLHRAVLRAYDGLISDGQHPLYALYLEVDPARVDVNIHPTKIEVKFEEEQPILAILKSAVKRGLGAHNVAPSIDFDAEVGLNIPDLKPGATVSEPPIRINPSYNPFTSRSSGGGTLGEAHGGWSKSPAAGWKDLYQVLEPEEGKSEAKSQEDREAGTTHAAVQREATEGLEILQWRGRYLLVPTEEGVAVVHIRRAHMRVLYERYLAAQDSTAASCQVAAQALLVPEDITLTQPEVMALMDAQEVLRGMGMELEQVDDQTVQLRAVPADLTTHVREALDSVLETFHDGSWDGEDVRREKWAKAWAQRAAATGDAPMPLAARRQLVSDLWACAHPNVDPMGRTALSVWAAEDLENPFR
ncbi:MAG: DNA mismatch repair endonuclease MutL [Flavobacteriales bacterium]